MNRLSVNSYKQLRKLHQKKFRDSEKKFMVSGLRSVSEVLQNQTYCLQLIVDETKINILNRLDMDLAGPLPINTLQHKDFSRLVDEQNPQGICLICLKPLNILNPAELNGQTYIYLDKVNDPGNLGTIIRSASWFAIDGILLSANSADPFQLKSVRSTAGTILNLSIYENVGLAVLKSLKKNGYMLYTTDIKDGEMPDSAESVGKKIILFGSEAHGLDKDLQDICDKKCYIKRFGSGESLNLAAAASIIMYQLTKN